MSDIVLVEGNNPLNVAMTPLVVGVAEFQYASDVRQTPWSGPEARYGGMKYEVDIQNIGGMPGSCTAYGYVDSAAGNLARGDLRPDFTMGTQVINPGQVATFKGQWKWGFEPGEDDWWFKDGGYIVSEVGCISYKFGRSVYPISVEVPPQIVTGSEFWTTQKVHLAGSGEAQNPEGGYPLFGVGLILTQVTGEVVPGAPGSFYISQAVIHAGYPGVYMPNGEFYRMGDIKLLPTASDYTIRGTYALAPYPLPSTSVPCKAIYQTWPPVWGFAPFPRGIYDVVSSVYFSGQVPGYGHWHDRPIWQYKVGQVQIV